MASAKYVTIVDIIKAMLSAVDNTGIVHTYQRNINDPVVFKMLCYDTANERISSWMISRESVSDFQSANSANTRTYPFVLRGYMGVSDAKETELIFQQSINDIADAFTPQGSLRSVVELTRPIQARTIAYLELHGVLCHYAELTMEVQEHLTS
jgi:hypothetical protein